MLTDRDVCLAVAERHQSPWEIPVRDVMSRDVVSVPIDAHVDAALVAMKEHRVRRVPVLDQDGHVKGLISIDDAIRRTGIGPGRLAAEAIADVLRHICGRAESQLLVTR
jgi:CBS-domain-containing membrane protein